MKALKFYAAALLMAVSSAAFPASGFNVWQNQTFTGPFTNGVVAVSPTYAVTTSDNSIKLFINYHSVTHSGTQANYCNCEINVLIEEEITSGVWIPIASQHSGYRILDTRQQRVLIVSPNFNADGNSDSIITLPDGQDMVISRTQESAPATFRIKLIVTEYVADTLQSITVSVSGRKFFE